MTLRDVAFILLGLATAFMARVVQHAVQQRRARALVNALIAEDDRPTPLDWRVHHVDPSDDPSVEAREEVCLVVTERGFDTAVTTFEHERCEEICEGTVVSRGGMA